MSDWGLMYKCVKMSKISILSIHCKIILSNVLLQQFLKKFNTIRPRHTNINLSILGSRLWSHGKGNILLDKK